MPTIFRSRSFDRGMRPLLGKDDRMRASLRKVGRDRLSPSGRVLPAALLVLLATTAACSGDRGKATTKETAMTPTAESTNTATARDTSRTAPALSDSSAAAT